MTLRDVVADGTQRIRKLQGMPGWIYGAFIVAWTIMSFVAWWECSMGPSLPFLTRLDSAFSGNATLTSITYRRKD